MDNDPVRTAGRVLLISAVIGFVGFFGWYIYEYSKGEAGQAALREEHRSGRADFGDQPALFALAQAILNNDPQAIRAAAAGVPDLQAPGRNGTTLLGFAVTSSWARPELVEAVNTLLSLGADPNHTNGHTGSFAMADAVHGSAALLRAMLDAGGDPNARDKHGWPIIMRIWYLGYTPGDNRAKLELLLERGADINSTIPEGRYEERLGYTVLLHRMMDGPKEDAAYADALFLLERGADPNVAGRDGMTFAKMLVQHREQFWKNETPRNFQALWGWAKARGLVP